MKHLVILSFLAVASCEQAPGIFSTAEKSAIAKDIRATLDQYYAEIRSNGLTAEFRYLDNSPDFFWVPPGYSSAISYDSVSVVLNQNAPLFKSIDNVWDSLRIIPLSKELASYTGRLRSTMIDTTGKVSHLILVETGFLIKREDGWKLLNGQTAIVGQ